MLRRLRPLVAGLFIVPLALAASVPPAQAVHLYRGPGGGCTPLDGAHGPAVTPAATIMVAHNTFNDAANLLPVTVINAGQSIKWTWNSSHCHSIASDDNLFYSGFHYPTAPPESPQVAPGVFEYPVLDDTPTLSYTVTFNSPGVYSYYCEHHAPIGMRAVVVVQ